MNDLIRNLFPHYLVILLQSSHSLKRLYSAITSSCCQPLVHTEQNMIFLPRQFSPHSAHRVSSSVAEETLCVPRRSGVFRYRKSENIRRTQPFKFFSPSFQEELLFYTTLICRLSAIDSPTKHCEFSPWVLVRIGSQD